MEITREEAKEFIAQSVKSDVDMAKVADAIKALEQELKWIPVSERLPEAECGESDSVLVCFENQTQDVLYFDGGNWCYPTGETYISVNHKNDWHNRVVAWMPLPKSYREVMKMANNIRFYIPDSLTIPTDLILYVEDTYVNYKRIHGGFRFHIHEDDEIKAMGIAKQIADKMIFEHDESEHGVTWCTVEFKIVEQKERYKIGTDIDWFYRIRDSY